MEIQDIEEMFNSKNAIIIKVKNETLDFTIRCGVIKYDVHIIADSEKLVIDNEEIKLSDLKTIYIWGLYGKAGYSSSLEIVQKGFLKGISLTVTSLSKEDIEKVYNLFEHFVFSNEKDLEKLTSKEYTPLIKSTSQTNNDHIKRYNTTDNIIGLDNIILLNNEYYLEEVLPKEYYNEYSKKKGIVIYQSKLANENYLDIWLRKESYAKKIKRNNIILIIKFILCILFILFLILRVFNII